MIRGGDAAGRACAGEGVMHADIEASPAGAGVAPAGGVIAVKENEQGAGAGAEARGA